MDTVPWTNDPTSARGAILAFTTADSKPAGSGRTARELGEEIARRGLLLYMVAEHTSQLQQLVDAAGGLMFPISNDPDPANMQKIAARISASIVQTLATGGTVPVPA